MEHLLRGEIPTYGIGRPEFKAPLSHELSLRGDLVPIILSQGCYEDNKGEGGEKGWNTHVKIITGE